MGVARVQFWRPRTKSRFNPWISWNFVTERDIGHKALANFFFVARIFRSRIGDSRRREATIGDCRNVHERKRSKKSAPLGFHTIQIIARWFYTNLMNLFENQKQENSLLSHLSVWFVKNTYTRQLSEESSQLLGDYRTFFFDQAKLQLGKIASIWALPCKMHSEHELLVPVHQRCFVSFIWKSKFLIAMQSAAI